MRDALRDPVLILGIICAGVALARRSPDRESEAASSLLSHWRLLIPILVAQQLTNATLTARAEQKRPSKKP